MINEREVFILIYLDNAATTKAFEEVLDTYLKVTKTKDSFLAMSR